MDWEFSLRLKFQLCFFKTSEAYFFTKTVIVQLLLYSNIFHYYLQLPLDEFESTSAKQTTV